MCICAGPTPFRSYMRLKLPLFGLLFTLTCAPAPPVQAATLSRPCEPLVKPAFKPLPPGAVEPGGWLRDWAEAARDGITGHLDEYHAVFGDAWKGTPVKAPNAAADGTVQLLAGWFGAARLRIARRIVAAKGKSAAGPNRQ